MPFLRQTGTAFSVTVAIILVLSSVFANWELNVPERPSKMTAREYSYIPGLFKHDTLPTGPETARAQTLPQLGIINRTYPTDKPEQGSSSSQWQRFVAYLDHLNSENPTQTRYKVLFVARHGEGVHNVKEREVGREEWDKYWSRLDGDENSTWFDPRLTAKGQQQAEQLAEFWKEAHDVDKVPLPQLFFTSPLTRCLQTTQATWSDLFTARTEPFRPRVVEAARELFGVHTCDRRRTRSAIEAEFPDFAVEPGMTENDELWKPDVRETLDEHAELWRGFLDQLFEDRESLCVSITTHSGATRALYVALGHPDVWTAAGSVVPIVVRARGKFSS